MSAEKLSTTLGDLLRRQHETEELTLGEVFQRIGDRGFGLLLLLLSLPSALPIPAPGYSTPFGLLIALLALQMLAGRRMPWLPAWAAQLRLHGGFVEGMLKFSSAFFAKIEFLIRPRLRWIGSRAGLALLGGLVLIMACLMILPIPFTNTFPAFVIFLIGIGLIEEDGLFALFGAALGLLSTALYSVVVFFLIRFGMEGVDMLKEWIKTLLG
jgi:hypothetical protein